MAHGTPDWGVTAGAVTTYQLTDLAEHAARVGSIVTFDRGGDVVFLEDFEAGLLRWTAEVGAADGAVTVSASSARSGRYSARLMADSDSSPFARVIHTRPTPAASAFGLEMSFTVDDSTTDWEMLLDYDDGVTYWELRARYVWVPPTSLDIWTPTGWVAIADPGQLHESPSTFHTLKLVGDPTTSLYTRLLLNQLSFDISTHTIKTGGTFRAHTLQIQLTHHGSEGVVAPAFLDDVIVTQNEPT